MKWQTMSHKRNKIYFGIDRKFWTKREIEIFRPILVFPCQKNMSDFCLKGYFSGG